MTPDWQALTSDRGRILPPNLDDRTWEDLVKEMTDRIPTYAPQWTDRSPSDLGITLIELFAWLVEQLIYRLNRVPDANYIAFLNLLGITRDPPTPARAYLTFTAQQRVTVLARTQIQTVGRETETPVIFETDEQVTVLPINLDAALLIRGSATFQNLTTQLTKPGTRPLSMEIPGGATRTLCLGFSDSTDQPLAIRLLFSRPVRVPVRVAQGQVPQPEVAVTWLRPQAGADAAGWPVLFPQPLARTDPRFAVGQWLENGVISIAPPAPWPALAPSDWGPNLTPATDADKLTDKHHWIAVRLQNPGAQPVTIGLEQVLFNAVSAQNVLTVSPSSPEQFPATGQPYQRITLAHQPLYAEAGAPDPYGHLLVRVGTTLENSVLWKAAEDFERGDRQVYRILPVSGEIQFGNFGPETPDGHGTIPPSGATIWVSYRYVAGGKNGNVGANTITQPRGRSDTDAVNFSAVTNLASAVGGSDEEAIEDTLRRAPEELRIRSRAVTAEDYEFLAREASTDVASVRCLPPRSDGDGHPWFYADIDRAPGTVNLIVVPASDLAERRPQPSPDLLREIQTALDRRRDLTARLVVRGPVYVRVQVKAKIKLFGKQSEARVNLDDLQASLRDKAFKFLHPVQGGPDGKGWQVGQSVHIAALFSVLMPPPDLGYVNDLSVQLEKPDHDSDLGQNRTAAGPVVRVSDFELVCASDDQSGITVDFEINA
jgi:hypothetical protein